MRRILFVLAERRNFQPFFCSLDFFFGSFFCIKTKERTFLTTRLITYSSSLPDSWQFVFIFFCSPKRKRTKRKGCPAEMVPIMLGIIGNVPSLKMETIFKVVMPAASLRKSSLALILRGIMKGDGTPFPQESYKDQKSRQMQSQMLHYATKLVSFV